MAEGKPVAPPDHHDGGETMFLLGLACGLGCAVVGVCVALLVGAAIGRAVTLPDPRRVVVPDHVPEAWSVTS